MANQETGTGASRVFFLNSADATSNLSGASLTTDYIFIPDESIVVPPHHTILMSIHHTQIPYSFYNFQLNRNCKLDYSLTAYDTGASGDTGTITLEEGNYNASTLLSSITTALNAESNVGTLTMRFNRDTLKYEYQWVPDAGAGYKRLTLRIASGNNASTNCRNEMGFNSNKFIDGVSSYDVWIENNGTNLRGGYSTSDGTSTTLFDTTTTPNATYWDGYNTAEDKNYFSVVDMNASIRSLYIRTNLTQHSVLDSSIGGGFSSILARIPIDVQSGGVITISPSDGSVHKLMLKIREITFFQLRLTDQQNRIIDLNGLDWDISLQFDFIEKPALVVPKDKRQQIDENIYQKFKEEKESKK